MEEGRFSEGGIARSTWTPQLPILPRIPSIKDHKGSVKGHLAGRGKLSTTGALIITYTILGGGSLE